MDTDSAGNVYAVGYTEEGSIAGQQPTGDLDTFVAKFGEPTGSLIWANQIGSPQGAREYPWDIAVGINTVNAVGTTEGSLDGSPFTPGRTDGFIWQSDLSGNHQRLKQFGGQNGLSEQPQGIEVGTNEDLLIVGTTFDSDLVTPGSPSTAAGVFLAEFDGSSLANSWYQALDAPSQDTGSDVAIDGSRVYVTGSTSGTLNSNPSVGGRDVFLAQFNLPAPVRFGSSVVCEADANHQHSNALIVDGSLIGSPSSAAEAIRVVRDTNDKLYVGYRIIAASTAMNWYGPYDGTSIDQVRVHGGGGNDQVGIGIGFEQPFGTGFTHAPVGLGGPNANGRSIVIFGGDGNDVLIGGTTAECIHGGNGLDNIYGRQGDDWHDGGDDRDFVNGGAGDDTLEGGMGRDWIRGGSGNDVIFGEDGSDTLYGGEGKDTIFGEDGSDTLYGGEGSDELRGGYGNDLIFGDAGGDVLLGQFGNDRLYGGPGNDRLHGDEGVNTSNLSAYGHDVLVGGPGDDALRAGFGSDLLYGNEGQDYLIGEDFYSDQFLGSPGGLPSNLPMPPGDQQQRLVVRGSGRRLALRRLG